MRYRDVIEAREAAVSLPSCAKSAECARSRLMSGLLKTESSQTPMLSMITGVNSLIFVVPCSFRTSQLQPLQAGDARRDVSSGRIAVPHLFSPAPDDECLYILTFESFRRTSFWCGRKSLNNAGSPLRF